MLLSVRWSTSRAADILGPVICKRLFYMVIFIESCCLLNFFSERGNVSCQVFQLQQILIILFNNQKILCSFGFGALAKFFAVQCSYLDDSILQRGNFHYTARAHLLSYWIPWCRVVISSFPKFSKAWWTVEVSLEV